MTGAGWLSSRKLTPEVMDNPGLDAAEHERALKALRRINVLSASPAILWREIRQHARRRNTNRLRVLDIATGSGDVPLALWKKAYRAGLQLEILGVDVSPRAVEVARSRVPHGATAVRFQQLDALHQPLPTDYDVLTCSLFLHHLTDAEARGLIHSMAAAARSLVLISDLRRSRYGWCLAYAASRLLTRSKVVHVDALLSVQAAFSMDELRDMALFSPLREVNVQRRWPCRMLLSGTVAQAPRA